MLTTARAWVVSYPPLVSNTYSSVRPDGIKCSTADVRECVCWCVKYLGQFPVICSPVGRGTVAPVHGDIVLVSVMIQDHFLPL